MAGWWLYATSVSLLIAVAGWLAERGGRAQGWPARWVWASALGGSLGIPLAVYLAPSAEPTATPIMAVPGALVLDAITPQLAAGGGAVVGVGTFLVAAWVAVSATGICAIGLMAFRLARRRRGWRRAEVDGVEVWVSRGTGPAALGLVRGEIVVPEWALGLDPPRRRLLVLHEAEHVRAGDPRLAVAALLACALVPWNLPLWWQLRRLRSAIELDCDARVLRRAADPRRYGTLLLEVCQRKARLAMGLAESRSMLERRLRMITQATKGPATLRAGALGAVAALVLAVACETPAPDGTGQRSGEPLAPEVFTSAVVPGASDCEPTVYLNGAVTSMHAVKALAPEGIASVEVRKPGPEVGTGEVQACGVIHVLTRDASPAELEAAETALTDAGRSGSSAPTAPPVLQNAPEISRLLMDTYPPLLRDAGIDGTVAVWLHIDAMGSVGHVQVNESSGHEALDQAALRAARAMRFTPAHEGHDPTPAWVSVPITFTLR